MCTLLLCHEAEKLLDDALAFVRNGKVGAVKRGKTHLVGYARLFLNGLQ